MNINEWLTTASASIPSDNPRLDAELLLSQRLGKSRAYLFAFSDETISNTLLTQLNSELSQLSSGYPLAYLLGKKDFWDMTLTVNKHTLIPRADTEALIKHMLTLFPSDTAASMIDLGTGSGAIALALSREFPKATITATDLSERALEVAKSNAKAWQKSEITFKQSSWLNEFAPQSFDAIISNPPYIEEDDKHLADLTHEPITALTAKNQGLADIEIIIEQSLSVLKPCGWLLLEHGYQQGEVVRALLRDFSGYQNIATHKDLGGNDRVTIASVK